MAALLTEADKGSRFLESASETAEIVLIVTVKRIVSEFRNLGHLDTNMSITLYLILR